MKKRWVPVLTSTRGEADSIPQQDKLRALRDAHNRQKANEQRRAQRRKMSAEERDLANEKRKPAKKLRDEDLSAEESVRYEDLQAGRAESRLAPPKSLSEAEKLAPNEFWHALLDHADEAP